MPRTQPVAESLFPCRIDFLFVLPFGLFELGNGQ